MYNEGKAEEFATKLGDVIETMDAAPLINAQAVGDEELAEEASRGGEH